MSATSISFALLIALFAILLLYRDSQAETADRWVRITKDVPVLRFDHISTKSALLWSVASLLQRRTGVRTNDDKH